MDSMVMASRQRRSRAIGRRVMQLAFAALTAIALLALAAPVHAEDRVAALNRMLGSSSEKTRLSAVLALAKLGEPRVDKPLIRALRDASPRVRSVAAAALGRLDCAAALPTLRLLARNDDDLDVRNAASTAAMKIHGASHPADHAGEGEALARRPAPGAERPGHAAFTTDPHPDLYVRINSSTDESPSNADAAARKQHADIIKRVLSDRLHADASITSNPADVQRWGIDERHLDLSVTRLAATRAGDLIEVEAQLRIAISDNSGRMLSLLSGGAKVQVPPGSYDPRQLPALRREALDNAMRGMLDKLSAQLRATDAQ
jgi:HEAT repeats